MAILKQRSPKPEPDANYRCLESHTGSGGTEVFREDLILVGSHPEVRAHPEFWIVASSDDEAVYLAKQARSPFARTSSTPRG